MKTTRAEFEIDFPEGKKTIEMELKEDYEIEDCEVEKIVVLNLCNGESYTGIFKGIDGEDVMLGSLNNQSIIGLPVAYINDHFEEIKE